MSGTGTAAATAIILMGLVVGLIIAQPSLEEAMEDLREIRKETTDLSLGLANSRISISSATHNNTTSVLNVTIQNEGSDVIDISDLDLLLNGTWKEWDPGNTIYIYPSKEVQATLRNVTDPISIKIIDRYGISDQTEDIETIN